MNDQETTVDQLKGLVAEFVREREWERYHSPKNLAMSIAIEAAEIMEMFQWLELDAAKQRVNHDPEFRAHLCEELADVTAYVLSLCQQNGIDLAAAMEDKMAKNRRKYPAAAVRGLDYSKPQD
ncbi:MAG TPA: nucleotide pyrophosphohydrolase [bacterium]|nr:nucleotide pyrophosphohydrolase [bacterium]